MEPGWHQGKPGGHARYTSLSRRCERSRCPPPFGARRSSKACDPADAHNSTRTRQPVIIAAMSITAPSQDCWKAATTAPALAPSREESMTSPAMQAWPQWWRSRWAPDFIAREVVGPLAIADLVAVRFDHGALRDRRAAGIGMTDDFSALRVILSCRRAPRTTLELAATLGYSPSGARRAIRVGYEIGAITDAGRYRHRTHPAWRPAGRRIVAVELKRTDWRRAADQAWAYQAWANAAWLVLGQRPPQSALPALTESGIGLSYLGDDHRMHVVLRPRVRRYVSGHANVWASEQALAHALSAGADPLSDARQQPAKWQAVPVAPAG